MSLTKVQVDSINNTIKEHLMVDEVKMGDRLAEDLESDDLDIIELVMKFEIEFNISIDDVSIDSLLTVQDFHTKIDELIDYK